MEATRFFTAGWSLICSTAEPGVTGKWATWYLTRKG